MRLLKPVAGILAIPLAVFSMALPASSAHHKDTYKDCVYQAFDPSVEETADPDGEPGPGGGHYVHGHGRIDCDKQHDIVFRVRVEGRKHGGVWYPPHKCWNPLNADPCEVVKDRRTGSLVGEPVGECPYTTSQDWRTWVRVRIDGVLQSAVWQDGGFC